MVIASFGEADGLSDVIGVVRKGQRDPKSLTLHNVNSVISQNIDGEVDLQIKFTDGHGYNKTDMANCFVLNGLIQGVVLVCKPSEAPDADDRLKINLPLSGLDENYRRTTIYYDGDHNGYLTKVTYPKALEEYCKDQAAKQHACFQPSCGRSA